LKKYLWVPLGGLGPLYFLIRHEETTSSPGTVFSGTLVTSAGIFLTNQWTQSWPSGSTLIIQKLLVPSGTLVQLNSGLTSSP